MYLAGTGSNRLEGVLLGIPSGAGGVRATLLLMRDLVRTFRSNLTIRSRAAALVQHLPQKAWARQVAELHAFVRDGIRYLRDTNGVEVVQTPLVTLAQEYGDCDDKATLLGALLESIGHPVRFVAVGFEPGRYSHVYVETKIGDAWTALETTAPYEPGAAPLRVMQRMTVKV